MDEVLVIEMWEGDKVIKTPVCTLLELVLETADDGFGVVKGINEKDLVFVEVGVEMTVVHLEVD
jgi:hypothetical protein